ncbi:hypothetical protein CTI12_AA544390 [Artemisia annua]|uniref:KIB1-4 beta-propeller domain-containing protein n=1 Tax=Artemisia annua TaxID=35608 RepID=A0A2U1L0E5_ARTAN|nr:hypothetical protein CTI12_AA544390 [Artemisia annua]
MEAKHKEISCDSVMPPNHPWFVSQKVEDEGDNTQFHIFYNIHDPMSHYRCQIPELLGKRIRGCFHGCWVVLSSNHPRDVIWSLWNPITSQVINLPPLKYSKSKGCGDDMRECCLSAPPEDPNSVLLLMRTTKPNFVYCRLGMDSSFRKKLRWTKTTYTKKINILTNGNGSLHCLTCCNGKVYAYILLSNNLGGILRIVEVNIVINDCEIKKQRKVVITFLPLAGLCYPLINDGLQISPLLKGSSTELFLVVLGLKDKGKTVGTVNLRKLDMNNMMLEEIKDLKDTILSVELDTDSPIFYSPAIASSEFGGYIHILADKGKIIYSYHVKDKTISFSSIPCVAGTNHVSAWAMLECTRLEGDRVLVGCKQEKERHKEDEIVVRSVKGNHEVEPHLLSLPNGVLKMKEFCVCVECLKLSPLRNAGYECRLESDKADDDESHLLNLPPHVLEMLIMEFCAGVEYLKFRATCKRCHLAAPLIPWNNGKASKIMQKYSVPSPWLIVFDKHKGIITLTDPVFGDKYFIKAPQELICNFQIKCSRFGWLLILKPCGGGLLFYNPFTSEILELPRLPYTDVISFSAPPTSPNCMIVAITVHVQWHAYVHIVGGKPSWRRILLDVRDGKTINSVTFYGQDLYVLRDDGGLAVFSIMDSAAPIWVCDLAPVSCCPSLPQCFHLKCDQHLLRIIVAKFGESVEVFKLTSSKTWEKVVCLGKHMIFICGASSVCLDAITPQMANRIYFPSSPIMYYSLETCRFHTLNNEDSFGDFFGTKHHLTPHGWIEPRWS